MDFDFSYYCRRSLGTAVLAAKFADQLAPRHREEAFIGGLMSDVGVVIMLRAIPNDYAAVAAEYAPLRGENFLEQELAALGITHADVSSVVMDKWKLPPIVVEAVRQHHSDTLKEHKEDDTHTLARILGAAGLMAKLLCEIDDKEVVAQICAAAMEIVGLNALAFQNVLQGLDSNISDFAKLLNVDIIESKMFSRLCEIVAETLEDQTSAV
ncbi:MAG: HDOD domain-containing protein [Proteobacteria bacterium]|nr:HDOD domain-containing protein [Pseudomonadota bacterium]